MVMKFKLRNFSFLMFFLFMSFASVLGFSQFNEEGLGRIVIQLLVLLGTLSLIIDYLTLKKIRVSSLFFIIISSVLALLSVTQTKSFGLLILLQMIMIAKDSSLDSLLKYNTVTLTIAFLFIIFTSLIGITDPSFHEVIKNEVSFTVYRFGFGNPNSAAAILFAIVTGFNLLHRNRFRKKYLIGEVVLAVLVYRIFGSRTFAAVMIGYGLSILLITYLSKIRATLNLLWPIQYFFLAASIATLYLSLNYNMLGNTWYDLDVVLSGRLSTWYWIINYYGIHLFGTDMSSLDKGLDNGYLYLLMYSGIFSLIIYNLIFYFVAKKAWNNQEWMILITMLFYNVYAFFESTPLFGGLCNILLIFAYLVLGKQREKSSQVERNQEL